MDRQEYLLVIILSHIWAFLVHCYQAKTTNKNNIISFITDAFHTFQFPHRHKNILHSSKYIYNKWKYTFIIYKLVYFNL